MRHVPALIAAVSATVVSSFAHAQVLISDNFDDGLAANRWTFVARENGVDPSLATPDATINYAFNYGSVTYESNEGTVGTGSGQHGVQKPIGAAPNGGGTIGVQIHVNDGQPAVNAIVQAAIYPTGINVGTDFIVKTDMFLNYNAPSAGSGSTESYMLGLNASGSGVVGQDLTTGSIAANLSANGYAFEGSSDGDNAGDYRVYALRIPGDDGARYSKLNATWTGTSRQPFIDGTGTYTGGQILPEEANGGAGTTPASPYRGFTNSNTYYRDEVMPNSQGYEVAGVVGKHWVTAQVEQHGKIALYMINGKVINHLFLPSGTALTGQPQIGLVDGTSGQPDDPTDSYLLLDNTSVTALTASTANTIPSGATYVTFNSGGTQTVNGAANVNGITMDTTPTTLAGTGTLTLGSPTGAIWSGNGDQVISKPLAVAADSAFYVETAADSLTISKFTTTDPTVDLTKAGLGKLTVSAGFTAKSLTIGRSSKMALSGAGGTKLNLLYLETPVAAGAALPLPTNHATLDFGRSVVAVDYLDAPSVTPAPTIALDPIEVYRTELISGFAADGSGNPQWNGVGLITTAPEVQGAAFNDLTNKYTVRIVEASAMGYTNGSSWMGKTIDATTAMFGFTFKADSNLDQTVGFADLVTLAQHYNQTGLDVFTSWTKGDANSDGTVGFADLVLIAQNYNQSVSGINGDAGAFASDWALAQTFVPEPTSLALLGLGGLVMGRRRR